MNDTQLRCATLWSKWTYNVFTARRVLCL